MFSAALVHASQAEQAAPGAGQKQAASERQALGLLSGMNSSEVQSRMLRVLATGTVDARLGRGDPYLAEALRCVSPEAHRPSPAQIMETVWSLVAQGLAYIDYSQSATENWAVKLTAAGIAAAKDEEVNPDDPGGYIRRLIDDVPGISDVVRGYAEEAVRAYNARLYRSSAVMLGVGSEAAVLEAAHALGSRLTGSEAQKYGDIINARKQNYVAKFEAFRKKLESHKGTLPAELADGMDLMMNAVADLLRVYRNDTGHPTGVSLDREDCFIHLRMFVRYAKKLYAIKAYLAGP